MLPHNTYVIIGPESTGKTMLCQQLADYFNGAWIPEYARTYIEQLNRPYTYDDVIHIAKKQIEIEQQFVTDKKYVFIDTDVIITKVWLQHVFKNSPVWIDEYLKHAYRKAYLLTYPDLPWEFDPVRENPHLREYLFNWYEKEIKAIHAKYVIIKDKEKQRIMNAIKYIKNN
ncbi:MAG: ATP-binding protein [Bacteroidales bacterium]|nr:ATP-binding protein [Bacteroidales bacterium]